MPSDGSISRSANRPSVDLPQPNSPTMHSVSPGCTANDTSSTARNSNVWRRNIPRVTGNRFVTPRASRTAVMLTSACQHATR